jgi:hypothetical protein
VMINRQVDVNMMLVKVVCAAMFSWAKGDNSSQGYQNWTV